MIKQFKLTMIAGSIGLMIGSTAFAQANSNISTIGSGNLVTGQQGVSDGYSNIVTSVDGTAQGSNAIATGQNLTKEEFKNKLNNYNDLLQSIKDKENELNSNLNNADLNNNKINNIQNNINDLDRTINNNSRKTSDRNYYNQQLDNANNELDGLKKQLEDAKNEIFKVGDGTHDRTIWTDFTSQIVALDWSKLTDNSNGTTGRVKVATELKEKIETDFPELSKHDTDKYVEIINGYINRQGIYNNIIDSVGNKYNPKTVETYNLDAMNNEWFDYKGILGTHHINISRYNISKNYGPTTYFLESLNNSLSSNDNIFNTAWNIQTKGYENTILEYKHSNDSIYRIDDFYKVNKDNPKAIEEYNALLIINAVANKIYELKNNDIAYENITKYKIPLFDEFNSKNYMLSIGGNVFTVPPIKDGNISVLNSILISKSSYRRLLQNIFNNQSNDTMSTVEPEQIATLKGFVKTYKTELDKIDLNADESKWMFDSEHYKNQLTKINEHLDKVSNYIENFEKLVQNPNDQNLQELVVTQYNDLVITHKNPENFYENITYNMKQEAKDLYNYYVDLVIKDFNEESKKLKLYDPRSEVIKGTVDEANRLKDNLTKAEQQIAEKQKEIDRINQELDNLKLTDEEQAAEDLKKQKEEELKQAQADAEKLKEDKSKIEKELSDFNNQLQNSSLRDIGKDNISIGTNAYSSGEKSISIGANGTVIGDYSISVGSANTISGSNAVAIGNNNTVESNNAFVLGNNVNVGSGFDNTVVLGNNSTPSQAKPVASMTVRGIKYDFAGINPTSTVSVGSVGSERQVTNVAAGRVSSDSTDAINGSQLFALQDAVENLKITNVVNTESDKITINGQDGITVNSTSVINNGKPETIYNIGLDKETRDKINREESVSTKNKNLSVTQNKLNATGGKDYEINMSNNLDLSSSGSIKMGDVSISNKEINMGGNKIQNVADGEISETSKEAINGSQLYKALNNLPNNSINYQPQIDVINKKINVIDKKRKAGLASAMAISGLPQAYREGQSNASAAIGQYQNSTALAIGYSSITDNGKWMVKGAVTTNTEKETGANVGVGYFW